MLNYKTDQFTVDVTLIVKDQNELKLINKQFQDYEKVAGAKLNQNKTEV